VLQCLLRSDSLHRIPVQASAQKPKEVFVIGFNSGCQLFGARPALATLRVREMLGVVLRVWGEGEEVRE
jgi:hypothetical protein